MKTVRSFANEEEEAEVFLRKLQQVYKLNRKEAAAYMSYVWGSGVRVWSDTGVEWMGIQIGIPCFGDSLGPHMWVSSHQSFLERPQCPSFRGLCLPYKVAGLAEACILRLARVQPRPQPLPREWREPGLSLSQEPGR